MQAKLTLTAGIGFTQSGHHIPELPVQIMAIRAYLAQQFGGYSETDVNGGWVDDAGQLVQEHAKQWHILTDTDSLNTLREQGEVAAAHIAQALDQTAVVVAAEPASFAFVRQPAKVEHHEIA